MSTLAKFTVPEYERIIATGVFDRRRRIELIRGELRERTPTSAPHAAIVDRAVEWSHAHSRREQIRIRVQNPVAFLEVESEPEPDLVWAKRKDYSARHPAAGDVLLLIEVADSSLEYDRTEKAEIYAAAGIRDYWIVNLNYRLVEVYRDPRKSRFATIRTYGAGETIQPLAAPTASLIIDDLFASPK